MNACRLEQVQSVLAHARSPVIEFSLNWSCDHISHACSVVIRKKPGILVWLYMYSRITLQYCILFLLWSLSFTYTEFAGKHHVLYSQIISIRRHNYVVLQLDCVHLHGSVVHIYMYLNWTTLLILLVSLHLNVITALIPSVSSCM